MTKNTYILLLIVIICLGGSKVKGQYTSPEVIATAGDFFSNATVSISWTLGEITTETFTGSNVALTQGFQQPTGRLKVSGQLTYKNTVSTPVSNTKVYLRTFAGTIVDSAITASNGNFQFYDTPAGTYKFKVTVTKTWGGVNSTDALLVSKHYVMLALLTGLNKSAADVNNSGFINSLDALIIAKRFTGIISTFSLPDWLYSADTIILGSSPVVHNLKSICSGDVNGSYIPALKLHKNIDFTYEGEIQGQAGKDITVPLKATENTQLGAISLVVNLGEQAIQIKNVEMPANNGTLQYYVIGNQLRISWYSTIPLNIEKDEPVFFIKLTSQQPTKEGGAAIQFSLTDESEIADPEGLKWHYQNWSIPSLTFGSESNKHLFTDLLPNPFSSNTQLLYNLSEPADVRFTVLNTLGQVIKTNQLGNQTEGPHTFTFDGSQLSQGIYFGRIDVIGKQGPQFEMKRMVIAR